MNITWCTTQAILDKCVVSLDCDLCSFIITVFAISLVMYMTCIHVYIYVFRSDHVFLKGLFSVVFFYKQMISLLFQSISIYTYRSKEKYESAVLIKKKKRQMIPVPNTSTEYYNICFLIAATLENFIVLCIH